MNGVYEKYLHLETFKAFARFPQGERDGDGVKERSCKKPQSEGNVTAIMLELVE